MTKTKRETYVKKADDKKLNEYLHAHTNRGLDRLISALNNLQIASYAENPEVNIESAKDYIIKALEDVSAMKYAARELEHRYRYAKKNDRIKAERLKMLVIPNNYDAPLPEMFFEE